MNSFFFPLCRQSNRIIKIENLGELESLEELYLSHNSIEVIENLDENVSMKYCHSFTKVVWPYI